MQITTRIGPYLAGLAILFGAASAHGQIVELDPLDDEEAPEPEPVPVPEPEPVPVPPPVEQASDDAPFGPAELGRAEGPPPEPPPPPIEMRFPRILLAPSGRLLPAAVVYSSSSLDTGGGAASDLRVGLGDVAEFGVALVDFIRKRDLPDGSPERVFPYFLATFKMGVDEDRLFRHQPALALGFRKSFEHATGRLQSRVAGLYLVGTKSLGDRVALHGGGVFWDAQLESPGGDSVFLHQHPDGIRRQLRAFGGIEVEPLPDARILVEVFSVPEFRIPLAGEPLSPGHMRLATILSWGVRYQVTPLLVLESGVRVADIADANLIDAQIFGQVTVTHAGIRDALRIR
jgi:hypothetical protein